MTARMKVAIIDDQSRAPDCPAAELVVSKPFADADQVVRRLAGLYAWPRRRSCVT